MLPTVLINAIPAAAAAPVRNLDGNVQKFGRAANIEHAVTVITAMVAVGEPINKARGMLTAPTTAGIAMCHVFTPRFSRPEVEDNSRRQVRNRGDQALLVDTELSAILRFKSGNNRRKKERQGVEAVNKPKVDQGESPHSAVKEHRSNAGMVQDVFTLRFKLQLVREHLLFLVGEPFSVCGSIRQVEPGNNSDHDGRNRTTPMNIYLQPSRPNIPSWAMSAPAKGAPITVVSGCAK